MHVHSLVQLHKSKRNRLQLANPGLAFVFVPNGSAERPLVNNKLLHAHLGGCTRSADVRCVVTGNDKGITKTRHVVLGTETDRRTRRVLG